MRIELVVRKSNGEGIEVSAGQREFGAWEREPFGCSSAEAGDKSPVLFFRYLAYAALKHQWRLDHIDGKPPTFDAWDATVEEVEPADDDAAEADPTKTDQSPAA